MESTNKEAYNRSNPVNKSPTKDNRKTLEKKTKTVTKTGLLMTFWIFWERELVSAIKTKLATILLL